MSEENSHVSVKPSESVSREAGKRVERKPGRKGEPAFHLTEQMRRLSTPWGVALARAGQIDPGSLGPGIILDAAVGSGLQLIAYSNILKRPSLGVEVDGNVAVLCAANMFSAAGKDDIQRSMDRVVIGDSTDSVGVMNEFWSSLRESGTRAHPPVAMLHLDPARPRDAQKHHIDEMEPPIESVLSSWKQYLELGPRGPCIILDLSPRLDIGQRSMIDETVERLFPGCGRTWEWLSRGGGRVDRLSLWIGSLSSNEARRCIRMGTKKIMASIEGDGGEVRAISLVDPPPFESWITIVDPVVLESGLQDEWISKAIPDGALYRIPISKDGTLSKPELILKNLYFANGFYIDEKRNKLYLSEMMKNRVLSFDIDIITGSVSNQTTLAVIPTPDNMELDSEGNLWISSPLANQIFSVDPENGETYVVFDAQTQIGLENMEEAIRRMELGNGFAELLTSELTGEMPGLLTGLIIGDESQPFYVANLGTALIKVSKE